MVRTDRPTSHKSDSSDSYNCYLTDELVLLTTDWGLVHPSFVLPFHFLRLCLGHLDHWRYFFSNAYCRAFQCIFESELGVNLVLVSQSELPFDTHFLFTILVKTMHLDSTPLCIQNEVNLVTTVNRFPIHAILCTTALHVDQEGALFSWERSRDPVRIDTVHVL